MARDARNRSSLNQYNEPIEYGDEDSMVGSKFIDIKPVTINQGMPKTANVQYRPKVRGSGAGVPGTPGQQNQAVLREINEISNLSKQLNISLGQKRSTVTTAATALGLRGVSGAGTTRDRIKMGGTSLGVPRISIQENETKKLPSLITKN